MTISLDSIPSFTQAEAVAAAERDFGIVGNAAALPSERDQNFLLTDAVGVKFVLKIANLNDDAALLDFQNRAMHHVSQNISACEVPRLVPTRSGADLSTIHNVRLGTDHPVRVLEWVGGKLLAETARRDSILFRSIGENMAKIDAALCDFTHPAMHRLLQWDIRHAGAARGNIGLLSLQRQDIVERIFLDWERVDWSALRCGVIHGDANDYNVIVGAGRMTGLLDFGDMTHSATVCDLAIALAYVMLEEREPLSAAAEVVCSYHRHFALTEAEQQTLFTLIRSRLAMSVCYAAHNRMRNPEDEYQVVTEASAWNLLGKLERLSPQQLHECARDACAAQRTWGVNPQ